MDDPDFILSPGEPERWPGHRAPCLSSAASQMTSVELPFSLQTASLTLASVLAGWRMADSLHEGGLQRSI